LTLFFVFRVFVHSCYYLISDTPFCSLLTQFDPSTLSTSISTKCISYGQCLYDNHFWTLTRPVRQSLIHLLIVYDLLL
jgi:hypothetical protein